MSQASTKFCRFVCFDHVWLQLSSWFSCRPVDTFTCLYFARECSDAFEVWWDILLSLYYKFIVKSVDERILKFGTDKKMFIMVTPKNSKNHQLYATAAAKKNDFTTKHLRT